MRDDHVTDSVKERIGRPGGGTPISKGAIPSSEGETTMTFMPLDLFLGVRWGLTGYLTGVRYDDPIARLLRL